MFVPGVWGVDSVWISATLFELLLHRFAQHELQDPSRLNSTFWHLVPSPSRARRAWSSFTKSRWAFSLLERNANSTRAFYLEWLIYRIGARNLMRGPSVFASIYTNLQGSGSVACWLRRRWSLQCSSLQFQLRALPVSAIEQSPCQ